ncbi:helix-turn-helix domain-containing protein [Microtetraspora niveoalba]|uniref:helix-turn-helix domain-containing protein n=1 Tax=Microtetraspora niveoalba TaxID=46175 RepID=UPI000831902B|nr:helix-turn-helix domain-containing protein [Microtetraspora niveoalba]
MPELLKEGDPLMFTVRQAAEKLGLGKTKTYELINSGRLRSVYVDGCHRVTFRALLAFIAELEN